MSRPWPLLVGLAACAALVVAFATALLGPTVATSAVRSGAAGTATVALGTKDPATASLAKAAVKIKATKPASASKSRWKLPVIGSPAADATSVALDGELHLAAGKRSIAFIGLRLSLGSKPTITGALGKKKMTLLTLASPPVRNAAGGTITFSAVQASLASPAAKAIKASLKLKKLAKGKLGTLTLTITVPKVVPAPPPTTTGATPAPAPAPAPVPLPLDNDISPPPPMPPPVDPFEADCPVGATSQVPPSGSQVVDPTLATGTDATGTAFSWGFRQTFRSYVLNTVPSGSLFGRFDAEYATDTFTFPFVSGKTTYPDAPAKAVLHGTGAAVFCGLGHGFRITIANPTVVIDGDASKLIADLSANESGKVRGPDRVSLATLNLTGISPSYDAGAKTITWAAIPASLTDDGADWFKGYYLAGEPLDPVTAVVSVP